MNLFLPGSDDCFGIKRVVICAAVVTAMAVGAAHAVVPDGFAVLGTQIPASAESTPIPPGFTEQFATTNTTPPTWTGAETARGYVSFTTNPMVLIYQYTRPLRSEITDTVDITSAPGEYEWATFSIHALAERSLGRRI